MSYKPEGYNNVMPYLVVNGAAKAIDFYKDVFGAREIMRMGDQEGRVGHAELQIGDSRICLADEYPDMGARSPQTIGGSPVSLFMYVPDADATINKAVAAGAKLEREVADQFYGDRMGGIKDPFGHTWYVATHKEDVPPEELKRRSEAIAREMAAKK